MQKHIAKYCKVVMLGLIKQFLVKFVAVICMARQVSGEGLTTPKLILMGYFLEVTDEKTCFDGCPSSMWCISSKRCTNRLW